MIFHFSDFLIGFTLMNAMPHLLFGIMGTRFFSAFGYGARGNIGYAFFNIAIGLAIYHLNYGLGGLINNGIVVGVLSMFAIYLISGKFFLNLFDKDGRQVR